MRAQFLAVLAFFLAGCAPQQPDPHGLLSAACIAEAAQTWSPRGQGPYAVQALARGPTCRAAVATLTIRDPRNVVIWTESFPTSQVMTLADSNETATSLRDALIGWINPVRLNMFWTGDLPRWTPGAQAPDAGEFPFYPEEWMNRDTYETLRTMNLPLYCYVQGMESIACLMLRNGRLQKIGVQTFPG